MLKEYMTFKSGKFYFSAQFHQDQILPLVIRAGVLNETLSALPLNPRLAEALQADILYTSISGTAMLEGNPMPKEDVRRMARGERMDQYSRKDRQEVHNLLAAYTRLAQVEASKQPLLLTEELIQALHKTITQDIPHENNRPGQYRNGMVYVGDTAHGGIYTPPKILADIKNLMCTFIAWINSADILGLDVFVRAALAHYHLCLIHPFWDGNGRTARLVEAFILQAGGIRYAHQELSNYYYRHVDAYYIAFAQSIQQKKDTSPFLQFMLTAAVESMHKIKNSIIAAIRQVSLRDFYSLQHRQKEIKQRQYQLLLLLLEQAGPDFAFRPRDILERLPFSLLYTHLSSQSIRRDVKQLTEKGYLKYSEDDKKYALNRYLLG